MFTSFIVEEVKTLGGKSLQIFCKERGWSLLEYLKSFLLQKYDDLAYKVATPWTLFLSSLQQSEGDSFQLNKDKERKKKKVPFMAFSFGLTSLQGKFSFFWKWQKGKGMILLVGVCAHHKARHVTKRCYTCFWKTRWEFFVDIHKTLQLFENELVGISNPWYGITITLQWEIMWTIQDGWYVDY